jgi:hypothetical protein
VRKAILILAVIGGLLAIIAGVSLGVTFALAASLGSRSAASTPLMAATIALSIAAIGIGLGALLARAGWQALAGKPGRAFTISAWFWWLLAFIIVLIAGQLLFGRGIDVLLPVFHILAAAFPPLMFLALAVGAARQIGQTSERAATGALAWGGLGGTGIALVLEGIAGLLALLVAMLWLSAVRPDLLEQLQRWALEMQQTGELPDLGPLREVVSSPLVALAGIAFASGFVPLVEELAKSLATPIVALTGRRLSRLDGFLIGVAAGAGFALVEGVFNGSLGLAAQDTWATAMLARGGAAAMHCIASGFLGLAWQAVLTERRWLRALGFALLGMLLHGAWNMAALGMSFSSVRPAVGAGAAFWRNMRVIGVVGFLGSLWLLAVALLAWLPRQLSASPVTPAVVELEEGGLAQ